MISRWALRAVALSFAALAVPVSPVGAEAQQPGRVYRIGVLSYFGCAKFLAPDGAFRQTLRSLGYVEGQNLVIECVQGMRVKQRPALLALCARAVDARR